MNTSPSKKQKSKAKSAAMKFMEELTGGPLTIAEVIKSLRACDEVNQSDFAKLLGISRQNLCDIEKGRKSVSPARAAVFAQKLGYPTTTFIRIALQEELDREGVRIKINSINVA